jgi:hypothetical protein
LRKRVAELIEEQGRGSGEPPIEERAVPKQDRA